MADENARKGEFGFQRVGPGFAGHLAIMRDDPVEIRSVVAYSPAEDFPSLRTTRLGGDRRQRRDQLGETGFQIEQVFAREIWIGAAQAGMDDVDHQFDVILVGATPRQADRPLRCAPGWR